MQARRLPTLVVATWSQLAGGLVLGLIVLGLGEPTGPAALGWGLAAGVFGGLGLVCFYRGLAIGPMSIVAPVAACGAIVPVLVAFALGRAPGLVALGGIATALIGVVLVSLPSGGDAAGDPRAALPVALGAALSFGLFFVFLDRGQAAGGPPLWVVAAARAGSLALLLVMIAVGRRGLGWPGRRAPVVGLVGVFDTTANVLFTYAAASGNLGVVSVLGSMYPVVTVLLARFVLAERLSRAQAVGVGLALAGVVLMAAG
jgi:drug/metabolite transporter (DMT)-like permease